MITFNFQEVKVKISKRTDTRNWIVNEIIALGHKPGNINFIFCNDIFLSELNIKYLKHNTLTDILTFDYSVKNKLSGDIFISVERVAENARKYGKTIDNELKRVMIHGVLHLAGLKDKTDKERETMRKMEDSCLERYFNRHGDD